MDKITNLKEVIKNSLRELMAKEQEINEKKELDPCLCKKDSDCKGAKEAGCYGETCFNNRCSKVEKNKNKVTTTISKKRKIKEAAFNMLNESCTCLTEDTGPGGGQGIYTPVYDTCASSQGNAVVPMSGPWCCTHMIHPQDICDNSCLDSNNPCFGDIEPPVGTPGKPFGKVPADLYGVTKDTRTRGVKPSMDRDFMSKDRMLNEAPTCEERGFSNCPFGSTCMGEPCKCQIPGRYNPTNGTWGCEKGCDCPPPAGFTTDLMKKN